MSLAFITALVMLVALIAYAVTGGADYGGGVWDLLASGPRRDAQRQLIAQTLAPIWEANHVWLIIVVVVLFTCFPPAFADLSIALHVPLSLMLIGIVLRGSAFVFRAYDSKRSAVQARWSRIFTAASVATPILLGVTIGAVASGRVAEALRAPDYTRLALVDWPTLFDWSIGVLTLATFTWLAAVYLCVETANDEALCGDFRRRALASGAIADALAAIVAIIAWRSAPALFHALTGSWWSVPLIALTALVAAAAMWSVYAGRFLLARFAAAAQVALVLGGWALAQYPYLVPGRWTIERAAAPRLTLVLVLIALAVGSVLLFPSLFYLFGVFRERAADSERRSHPPRAAAP